MAEQPTTHPVPEPTQPDHEVLHGLAQKLRNAGVVDNQVTREVHLSEADATALADTLEQMATRLAGSPTARRPGQPVIGETKP